MGTGIKIEGLAELDKALAELPRATAKGVLVRVLKKRAQPVAERAKALAPVGATGGLRASITVSTSASGDVGKVAYARALRAGASKAAAVAALRSAYRTNPDGTFAKVFVGPGRDQGEAHLVEFGTADRYQQKSGKYVGRMPAKPFMRPAWDASKDATLAGIGADLWAEIQKTAARRAKRAARLAAK